MYEVGLAHAVRLPEEVILFRSDNDSLMFDLANIRVNYYDPDTEPKISRQHVSDALTTAFKEIDLQKHLAVRRGSESLNFHEWSILIKSLSNDRVINPPLIRTMRDAASKTFDSNAITRLLELGIIKTNYTKVTSEIIKQEADTPIDDWKMMSYKVTSYGIEVIKDSATRMDVFTPKIIKVIESLASEENLQE
jgi:hypothetical protein